MEITYVMQCDNCKGAFESKEASPKRHLCPRCLIVFKAGYQAGVEEAVKFVELYKITRQDGTVNNDDEETVIEIPIDEWQAFKEQVRKEGLKCEFVH